MLYSVGVYVNLIAYSVNNWPQGVPFSLIRLTYTHAAGPFCLRSTL